ncbi:MAG TPA: MATE family efflux transporter [Lachnospiraceae bacterium]|nr:MATE family efflux transporter [Lachnospiraceae bacterium]HPF28947.1 MATE family efflux transporter [Lachnospiraceae bacterium]
MDAKTVQNKNTLDMTTGNTLGHLLRFTGPLLIGNVFQQLYNMVDSWVVGNYVGPNAIAAVGACGSMNFFFFSLSSGLAIGVGIIVAQYFGAKDEVHVKETIANSAYVLVVASLIVSILGYLTGPYILRLLQTPPEVIDDSISYMRTTCCGIVAIALYNGVSSILRALGDSKTPLYFLVISSIINVGLDLLFVLSFHWDVFGVALATIISQAISAIISIIYAYRKVSYFHLTRKEMHPNRRIIIKSIRLGLPVALQNSMIAVSMMALQGVVNTFGPTVMTAYTISSRVEQMVQQPYMSLSTAITNYSGQNIGANQLERVKKGFRVSVLIVLIFSVLLIPIAYIFGTSIIGAFVDDVAVINLGAESLRITSLCYFALGMIYVPRAVLNGCGDTAFSMINGSTEVVCRLIYSFQLTKIPAIGYRGIWYTTGLTWITTALICILRYLSGKWKYKLVTK